MRRYVIVFTLLSLSISGCSQEKKDQRKPETTSQAASENAQGDGLEGESAQVQGDPLFQLGMPEFCTLDSKDGQGCFTCVPRELPLTQCVALSATFDAAAHCHHDLDKMACDDIAFTWDFNERDRTEGMYEKLPLITLVAKEIIASKLKDKPDVVAHINEVIDLAYRNRLNIFTGKNLEDVAKESYTLIKKIWPDTKVNQDQIALTLAAISEFLKNGDSSGDMNEVDALQMIVGMLGEMPAELEALTGLFGETTAD